jgi:hypothetical protein
MPLSLGYHHARQRTARLHWGNHHDSFFYFIRHGVLAGVRQGRWKLLRHQDKLELYDLEADRRESTNKAVGPTRFWGWSIARSEHALMSALRCTDFTRITKGTISMKHGRYNKQSRIQ